MKVISDLVNKLKNTFKSKEYRHAYVDEFLNVSIATQIKVLREQRGWDQKALADEVGMKQPRISVMENVNYSSWSINTLRKLAKAFDVTLNVSFESFGNRIKDIEQFKREALEQPSFDSDPVFVAQNINLSTVCCATTTTPDVTLTVKEAHKELALSNEIPMIYFEHKEDEREKEKEEEEIPLAVRQTNPYRRQSHEVINRKASAVYLANLSSRPQSAWS